MLFTAGIQEHYKMGLFLILIFKQVSLKFKRVSTRLEARFPYYDLRVKTRSPSPFTWRPDFLAAPREAH